MNFTCSPIGARNIVSVPGMIVWCGSMVRTPDGRCHLMLSVWPESAGFDGWLSHSQIGYAVAETPDSEYEYRGLVFTGSGGEGDWDRDVVHNPWLLHHDGTFYLFYMGNYGDGTFRGHRFNQRIGLASADDPAGPWTRLEQPLPQSAPGSWDDMVTCNPSVCRMADGRFIMLYRGYSHRDVPPGHGDILLGAAFADRPEGPFVRHPEPVFRRTGEEFAAEDPGVFLWNGKLYAVFKDMGCYYCPDSARSLILAESDDGREWRIVRPLLTRNLNFADRGPVEQFRVERPFVHMEDGEPRQLFVAVKPRDEADHAFNVHMKIQFTPQAEAL